MTYLYIIGILLCAIISIVIRLNWTGLRNDFALYLLYVVEKLKVPRILLETSLETPAQFQTVTSLDPFLENHSYQAFLADGRGLSDSY